MPWLAGRVVDGGALAIAACLAGVALLVVRPHARGRAALPLVVGVALGVVAMLLSSRGLFVGAAAFLVAGCLRRTSSGALLIAVSAIHPADVDALVGWPLRALLAHGAAVLLAPFTATPAQISAETVLLIEGRIADVESACAGTRSLTAFIVCFCVLAALKPGRPTATSSVVRACAAGAVVLVAISVLRVATITGVAILADAPAIADIVHEPLGLFALLAAIAVANLLLSKGATRIHPALPAAAQERHVPSAPAGAVAVAAAAAAAIAIALAPLVMSSRSRDAGAATNDTVALALTAGDGGDIPLRDDEHALFTQLGARASKRSWGDDGAGSVLLVVGPRRAHHAPERCLAAAGFHVESATTAPSPDPDRRVRRLRLARDGEQFIGTSFFVSRDRVVASALERSMRDVVLGEGPWVFVSILTRADGSPGAGAVSDDDVAALVHEARTILGSSRSSGSLGGSP